MRIAIIYHSESGNTAQMAELIKEGCEGVGGIEARTMSIDDVDSMYVSRSSAVIIGAPCYEGSCSWQMKRYLDEQPAGLAGKLGGVFVSQNQPGGGGASFAEMTIIAAMLVHGMLIYSGGIADGMPFLHFGAVSRRAPEDANDRNRCLKLGNNIARKALELFGD